MVIKTPVEQRLSREVNLRIPMRLDNLREDGFVFHQPKGIFVHSAFGIAQPRGWPLPVEHYNWAGRRKPEPFFFYFRIRSKQRTAGGKRTRLR